MTAVFAEGVRERVLERALTVAGMEQDDRTEVLLDAVAQRAAQVRGIAYIPKEMETVLAELLAMRLTGDDQAVSQVKRGDTTITYGQTSDFSERERQLLAPFVRLRSPKGRWRR